MFKMFTTGQNAYIQMILRKSAASYPISAAAHSLASKWSLASNEVCKISVAMQPTHNSQVG